MTLWGANVALTVRLPFIVSVQMLAEPKLAQAPPQPLKKKPLSAAAVRSSAVPPVYVSLQSAPPVPQLMPVAVTVPWPGVCTVRVALGGLNAASTVRLEVMLTRQEKLPRSEERRVGKECRSRWS